MQQTHDSQRQNIWNRTVQWSHNKAMRLFLCAAAKTSIILSMSNDWVRSRSIARTATLSSFSLKIEFLTQVLMCLRAEKLLSHDAVETGREIAMTPSLYNSGNASLYRSMCEMKPTNVFGLSSLLSLSNKRFAWWSSWLKSVTSAAQVSSNWLTQPKSAKFSLEGFKAWMDTAQNVQWVEVNRRSNSLSNLSKTGKYTFILNPTLELTSDLSPTVSVTTICQMCWEFSSSGRTTNCQVITVTTSFYAA